MSYYEPQGWQAPARQPSWEQPAPPSRSGASSTSQSREDGTAFACQFEEVERAVDNLVKSGKILGPGGRREMGPSMAGNRPYGDQSPMHGGMGQRHPMDFDPSRSHPASNLQNFYASQRHSGRQNDADQVAQAKRRMAAQRERELRNYHQEQQYNRSVLAEMSSNKSDRSLSPSTMSEEGRQMFARQQRNMYGNEGNNFLPPGGFSEDNNAPRESGSNAPPGGPAKRGNSPRNTDPFGMGQTSGQQMSANNESALGPAPSQDTARPANATLPANGPSPAQFGSIDNSSQQTSNTRTSPAQGESPTRHLNKATTAPIGPIGSRSSQQPSAPGQGLKQRATTPLASPMNNLGFGQPESAGNKDERPGSANSNPANPPEESGSGAASGMGPWGTGSGVWGSNKIGTTSVWG